jgi:hypothetical protein
MKFMDGTLYNLFYFIDSNSIFLISHIDHVFMTTNLSLDQINTRLNIVNEKDETIRTTRSIGSTLEFLGLLVKNTQ